MYQAEQISTYQIDLLKQEINKKVIPKADPWVDKTYLRIRCPNLQFLIVEIIETVVLVSGIAQKLLVKNGNNPDIYFTLLDATA